MICLLESDKPAWFANAAPDGCPAVCYVRPVISFYKEEIAPSFLGVFSSSPSQSSEISATEENTLTSSSSALTNRVGGGRGGYSLWVLGSHVPSRKVAVPHSLLNINWINAPRLRG